MKDHHKALIYTMVIVSAADGDMSDAELSSIGEIVDVLPVFKDFDKGDLIKAAQECAGVLQSDNGLNDVLRKIKKDLPKKLRETAYAIGCDVAAADGEVKQEEARILELLRYQLKIDRLISAGIERGARARHLVHKKDK